MYLLLAVVQLMLISGCSRSVKWLDQRDRSDVLVQRALARKVEGDIDSAIKLYAEALDDNQRLARAHLDLALLLHSHKEDYLRAIYHYERYLELCPQTEKRDMIENRIRIAKQSFGVSVVPRDRKDVPEARVTDDRIALAGQAATWTGKPDRRGGRQITGEGEKADEVAALKKENTALKSKVSQLSHELEQIRAFAAQTLDVPETLVRHSPRTADTGDEGGIEQGSVGGRKGIQTYRVMRGDTLASIAAEICKDASMWKKIYEANRDKLRSPDDIKVGQILVIP